jgi:hypothetical protein
MHRFVVRWVVISAVVETIAVCIVLATEAASWGTVIAVVLLEGLLLGFGQRWILRNARPRLADDWVAATIAGALLGRCVQFAADTGPYAAVVSEWNLAAQVALGAALGALVGALMALPQAIIMRGQTHRPLWWIAARAVAWCIALPSLILAGSAIAAVSNAGPVVLVLAILLTIGAAAAFVGLLEGVVLERLLGKQSGASLATTNSHERLGKTYEFRGHGEG